MFTSPRDNLPPGYTGVSSDTGDVVAVILYFVTIVVVWIYATFREYKDPASGHILGGRSVRWMQIGASLFVCNIGSEQFFGLSQSGAAFGISMGAREFSAILVIQLLCWIFVPVYMACGVSTTPEYLSKRFGGKRLRVFFAISSIVLYIITKLSVDLHVASLFHPFVAPSGWPYFMTYIILGLIKLLVGVRQIGNLKPISIIDPFQFVVALIGGVVVMSYAFSKVGGLEGLYKEYARSTGVQMESFQLLRPADDYYMPWLGFLLGQTPGFIWYWCADQVIVQRLLVARSLTHAQGAGLMAGVLKVLPFFLMVLPGMISQVLNPATGSSYAYPLLLLSMPTGLRGLMLAVLLVCTFSNISSTLDTLTAIFAVDIWNVVRKDASPWELDRAKRICFVVVTFMSVGWMVLVSLAAGDLLTYIQTMTNYLAPPFAAIFLLGVFVPRTTEKGAFWALVLGSITGSIRLILSMIYSYFHYNSVAAYNLVNNFHYMYFGLFSFLLTAVMAFVISLLSNPPEGHRIGRTTFWTRKSQQQDELQLTDFDELAENQSAHVDRDEENADTTTANTHSPGTGFVPTNGTKQRGPISPQPAETQSSDSELIFVEDNSHGEDILRLQSESGSSDSELVFLEGNSDGEAIVHKPADSDNIDSKLIIVGEDNRGGAKSRHLTGSQSSNTGVIITDEDNHGDAKPGHWTRSQSSDKGVLITDEGNHGGARPRQWTRPQSSDKGVLITDEGNHGGAKPGHWTRPQSSDKGVLITDEGNHGGAKPRHRTRPQSSNNGMTITDEEDLEGTKPRHWTRPQSSDNAVISMGEDSHREEIRQHRVGLPMGNTDVPITEEYNYEVISGRHPENPQNWATVDSHHAGRSGDTENSQFSMFCDSWKNSLTERQAGDYKKTLRRRVSRFFKMRSPDEVKQRQLELHIQKISELRQNKMAVTGLRVGLVFVVVTGVFLFLFWSFWSPSYAVQLCGENFVLCQDIIKTTQSPLT